MFETILKNLTIVSQLAIPSTTFTLDLPDATGGIFSRGIFAGAGFLLYLFLVFMVVAWVALSLYGGVRIIMSFADQQKIEGGIETIKSVWIGATYFLGFFVVVVLASAFLGLGSPIKWYVNLTQCRADGDFYFQYKDTDNYKNVVNTPLRPLYVVCYEGEYAIYDDTAYPFACDSAFANDCELVEKIE